MSPLNCIVKKRILYTTIFIPIGGSIISAYKRFKSDLYIHILYLCNINTIILIIRALEVMQVFDNLIKYTVQWNLLQVNIYICIICVQLIKFNILYIRLTGLVPVIGDFKYSSVPNHVFDSGNRNKKLKEVQISLLWFGWYLLRFGLLLRWLLCIYCRKWRHDTFMPTKRLYQRFSLFQELASIMVAGTLSTTPFRPWHIK